MNKGKHCPFCGTDQALFTEGTPEAELHAISTRTLATFGEVRLCAGLGAIVEPYIIAYTRRHFHAATELDAAHRGDLLDALDGCLATKHFPSRKLTVFEHGSKLDRGSSACISHCHWHIIDGQYDLRAPLAITYQNVETASLSEAEVFVADEYLFTGSYDGRRIVSGVVARPLIIDLAPHL